MKTVIASGAIVMALVATVAWAGVMGGYSDRRGVCASADDVLWHQANSREGISLTCTTDMLREMAGPVGKR